MQLTPFSSKDDQKRSIFEKSERGGFKLKETRPDRQTSVPSSGVQWTILCAVIALIGIFALGSRRGRD